MRDMTFTQIFKGSLVASLLILAVGVNQDDVLDLMFGKPGQEITVVMMTDQNTLPQEDMDDATTRYGSDTNHGDRDTQGTESAVEKEFDYFGPWQPRRFKGHGNDRGSMK